MWCHATWKLKQKVLHWELGWKSYRIRKYYLSFLVLILRIRLESINNGEAEISCVYNYGWYLLTPLDGCLVSNSKLLYLIS